MYNENGIQYMYLFLKIKPYTEYTKRNRNGCYCLENWFIWSLWNTLLKRNTFPIFAIEKLF